MSVKYLNNDTTTFNEDSFSCNAVVGNFDTVNAQTFNITDITQYYNSTTLAGDIFLNATQDSNITTWQSPMGGNLGGIFDGTTYTIPSTGLYNINISFEVVEGVASVTDENQTCPYILYNGTTVICGNKFVRGLASQYVSSSTTLYATQGETLVVKLEFWTNAGAVTVHMNNSRLYIVKVV